MLGTLLFPAGYWQGFGDGVTVLSELLLGLSAAFTAWWAYKTFAFNEKLKARNEIYERLKECESAFSKRYGAEYNLLQTLLTESVGTDIVRDGYIKQMSEIEIQHKFASDYLNDLFYNPFLTTDFNVKLLLEVRVKDFKDVSEVQKNFHDIKLALNEILK